METKRKLVSILVPCYNEEQSLPLFYEEVTKVTQSIPQYDFEIFLSMMGVSMGHCLLLIIYMNRTKLSPMLACQEILVKRMRCWQVLIT